MTAYGKLITTRFAASLARAGLTIVSGLARGVDTIAHQSTLHAKARTIAVLAGGLNHLYPPENIALAHQISQNGVLLSQFPPDYPNLAPNFPARNRLIAGLAQAVLVTEASLKSGALITAREALDQGKDIFAIPGPITSENSLGTAKLIQNGAFLTTHPSEILTELNLSASTPDKNSRLKLSPLEAQIISHLKLAPLPISNLALALNQPPSIISALLLKLQLQGLIRSLDHGIFASV